MDVCDARGRPIQDDTFLLVLNGYWEPVPFILPGEMPVGWELILDTDDVNGFLKEPQILGSAHPLQVQARSLRLLRLVRGSDSEAAAASWRRAAKDAIR